MDVQKAEPGRFKIVMTIGVISTLIAAVLIVIYVRFPNQRDILTFAVGTLLAASGITSAYYVAAGLRASSNAATVAAQETARSARLGRTLEYSKRWGDPTFNPARQAVRSLVQRLRTVAGADAKAKVVREAIAADATGETDIERSLISVMNLLEELGLAIEEDVVDGELLKRLFRSTVVTYFVTLKPWIDESRQDRDPRIYFELEKLYDRWK